MNTTMRSAIFDKEPSKPLSESRPKSYLKNASPVSTHTNNNAIYKKAKSSSPYIGNGSYKNMINNNTNSNFNKSTKSTLSKINSNVNSTSTSIQRSIKTTPSNNTPASKNGATKSNNTNGSITYSNSQWNFDEMLNSYNDNGLLPNILSPTLPPQFFDSDEETVNLKRVPRITPDDSDEDDNNNEDSNAIDVHDIDMESNHDIDMMNRNDDNDSCVKTSHISSNKRTSSPNKRTLSPNKRTSSPKSKESKTTIHSDDENLPLSMLSPTLPSIFNTKSLSTNLNGLSTDSKIVQPTPKKPSKKPVFKDANLENNDNDMKLKTESKKQNLKQKAKPLKVRVRWINKIDDPKVPRFLLRINFDSNDKLKTTFASTSDNEPTGLGIMIKEDNFKQKAKIRKEEEKEREIEIERKEKVNIRREEEKDKDIETQRREKEKEKENEKENEKEIDKERKKKKEKERERQKDRESKKMENEQIHKIQHREIEETLEVSKENHEKLQERQKQKQIKEKESKKQRSDLKSNEIIAKDIKVEPRETPKILSDEKRRKTEQLEKLNQDLLRNEEVRLNTIERIRVEKNQSPVLSKYHSKTELTKAEKDEYKATLISKKNHWIKIAKDIDQQFKESSSDKNLKIAMKFDSILLYMISYDYDEKLKLISNILPSERYWNLMYQDLNNFILYLKDYYERIDSQKKVKTYVSFLIGLLYQTKSITLKRINAILKKVIESYIEKKSNSDKSNDGEFLNELNNKIIELQQQSINNHNSMTENFAKAQPYLSNSPTISINFPKTWYNRAPKLNPNQTSETSLSPGSNNFYLPINIYSNMSEMSGLIFCCVREFIEIFLTEGQSKDDTKRYKLKSSLKGAPDENFHKVK